LRDHTNRVCGMTATSVLEGTRPHDILSGSLIRNTTRSSPREAISKTHLHVRKAQRLSMELPVDTSNTT
jgi:hypothetical protein